MGLYLGLDSSTQSLSALVVDTGSGQVVLEDSVNFGQALPEYESPNGFLAHPDLRRKHANVELGAPPRNRAGPGRQVAALGSFGHARR